MHCIGCKKTPNELEEYVEAAAPLGITPEEYVRQEEGTYNRENGHFACTKCYIEMGQPSKQWPECWTAP
jgi:hypothetical protein